jgi:hypothetical protein
MKMRNGLIAVLAAVAILFAGAHAYAALSAVTESFNGSDATEINNAMPATAKTKLGTRLRGVLQNESAAVSTTGEIDLDEADTLIKFTSGVAGAGISESALGAGTVNQTITLVLVTDNGGNVDITPTTKTGFTSIQLNDAKDSCTLRWANDTDGWVVQGNSGCTIN